MKTQNVVIVGAPRSGTNMLRDVLTAFDGVATWPCDEVNLMWRHGNRDFPSDELTAEQATPAVRDFIRGRFEWVRTHSAAPIVVEKTCATSLRVPFVDAALPDAKFVFIARDGIDAAASAVKRWNAPLDLKYTAKKVRFVPPTDLPYYGARFIAAQAKRRRVEPTSVATWWGPKPHDYRKIMRTYDLPEVCALQWARCVDASLDALSAIDADRVVRVSYETFVANPAEETTRILDFLDIDGSADHAVRSVSGSSVGKGYAQLGDDVVARVRSLVEPTLTAVTHVS